ncbi:MAG: alpha-ketoglutarate-dependent dioxygenase AlkB [Gammaproteobacteria bacterium]|nr:alpha-ketoglutarate-dependent dioxygenase AlkB [Gammaproteobacteria bacterium]
MADLFDDPSRRLSLLNQDGLVDYWPHFMSEIAAQRWFDQLLRDVAWQTETYQIYGKDVTAPRRVAWYGDADAVYTYSGIRHQPLPWTPGLMELKTQIERACQTSFNSVLLNLYRDGQDSMGWHADAEPELGINPVIASLSLGEVRSFKLRHNRTGQTLDIPLGTGSLLLMHGALQHHWKHSVAKSKRVLQARINLTFRKIVSGG